MAQIKNQEFKTKNQQFKPKTKNSNQKIFFGHFLVFLVLIFWFCRLLPTGGSADFCRRSFFVGFAINLTFSYFLLGSILPKNVLPTSADKT